MLRLDAAWPQDDATPWCSAWLNYVAWLLRLPRSKSLAARSWLAVGTPIALEAAAPGWDVVVLARGDGAQPGPDVLDAPGHVGLFAGLEGKPAVWVNEHGQEQGSFDLRRVLILGGNQGDAVSVSGFPAARVLGVRRLWSEPAP